MSNGTSRKPYNGFVHEACVLGLDFDAGRLLSYTILIGFRTDEIVGSDVAFEVEQEGVVRVQKQRLMSSRRLDFASHL